MAHSPVTSHVLDSRLTARRISSRKARRQTDFGPLRPHERDDPFIAEAEASSLRGSVNTYQPSLKSPSAMSPQTSDVTATKATRPTGLKDMDAKLQKLEKLNFDLKMEVFHRREREGKLLEQLKTMHLQVRRVEKLQDEHTTLLELNQKLTQELEKSHEAVDQAVEMICNLEDEVEALKEKTSLRVPSSHADSGYGGSATPTATIVPPTPPRTGTSIQSTSSPRLNGSPRVIQAKFTKRDRIPSFMSTNDDCTQALREAYTDPGRHLRQAQSFVSMLSQDTTKDGDKMHDIPSPRLSVLSESSFPSIYDTKKTVASTKGTPHKEVELGIEEQAQDRHSHREDSIKRVSNWVEQGRDLPHVPKPSFTARARESESKWTQSAAGDDKSGPLLSSSDDNSPRMSTTSSEVEAGFAGYPDGGSIILGTPSRFRAHDRDNTVSAQQLGQRERYSAAESTQNQRQGDTMPNQHDSNDWPLITDPRHDSIQLHNPLPTKSDDSPRKSTRASLAAKTHKLWGRLSNGGARDSLSPPPKPNMANRRPLTKSATTADVARPNGQSSNSARMRYADHTQSSSTRRRSVDPAATLNYEQEIGQGSTTLHRRVQDLSRNGAQAAWEGTSGALSRSLSSRDGGGRGVERAWRA